MAKAIAPIAAATTARILCIGLCRSKSGPAYRQAGSGKKYD